MPTFTLHQIETSVYAALDGNTQFFAEPQVRAAINEGLSRLNLLIGFQQDIVPVPGWTRAGQLLYYVPDPVIIPMVVYIENRELEKVSLRELGQRFRNWAVQNTSQFGPTARWAPIGIRQFAIHPMDYAGGQMLEVQGITSTVALTAQNQTVTLDDEWCDLLVDYAKTRVLLKDSSKTFADASLFYQEFTRKVKTMTVWAGLKFPAYFVKEVLNPVSKVERVA